MSINGVSGVSHIALLVPSLLRHMPSSRTVKINLWIRRALRGTG